MSLHRLIETRINASKRSLYRNIASRLEPRKSPCEEVNRLPSCVVFYALLGCADNNYY
jgi:hypothetical protein